VTYGSENKILLIFCGAKSKAKKFFELFPHSESAWSGERKVCSIASEKIADWPIRERFRGKSKLVAGKQNFL
jgi:hypothetical protein